jgi:hypothetical protein
MSAGYDRLLVNQTLWRPRVRHTGLVPARHVPSSQSVCCNNGTLASRWRSLKAEVLAIFLQPGGRSSRGDRDNTESLQPLRLDGGHGTDRTCYRAPPWAEPAIQTAAKRRKPSIFCAIASCSHASTVAPLGRVPNDVGEADQFAIVVMYRGERTDTDRRLGPRHPYAPRRVIISKGRRATTCASCPIINPPRST